MRKETLCKIPRRASCNNGNLDDYALPSTLDDVTFNIDYLKQAIDIGDKMLLISG